MKLGKQWLLAFGVALGCAMPWQAFGQSAADPASALQQAPVQQTSSYWDAQPAAGAAQPAPAAPPATMQPLNAAPAACGSAPCDGGGCYPCGGGCGPFVLVESTFFWPQLHRNFLTSGFTNGLGTQTLQTNGTLGSANGRFLAAPRVTLGYQGECWGIVGRYWNASTWGSAFAPANVGGASTTGLTAFDGFRAQTADLELQRRFCAGCWNLYGFGGVRYASVANARTLDTVNSFGGPVVNSAVYGSQQFNGTGLTFGLWGFSPLWDCSPWNLYFVNRYSILWGTGKATSQTFAEAGGTGGFAANTNGATAISNTGDLFIAEVQAGLQWMAPLRCIPACAFFRTGVEYQYWNNGQGLGTRAISTAFVGGSSATGTAAAGDLLFSLIGFNIGAGIIF